MKKFTIGRTGLSPKGTLTKFMDDFAFERSIYHSITAANFCTILSPRKAKVLLQVMHFKYSHSIMARVVLKSSNKHVCAFMISSFSTY